ncbi:MAG: S41 family peptidase [Synechococcales bacterium]|nr:S41 family peptidase [Synechococcales bacterium]
MRKFLVPVVLSFIALFVAAGVLVGQAAPGWAYPYSEEHKLLSEVWRIVDRAYVDDTFNNQNWWYVRQRALKQPLPDRESTYQAIEQMLASLDDPFTRFLEPDQYRSLQTTTSGELTGIGLQITQNADTGLLQVIAPVAGSPAEQAGILPDDQILQIDGTSTIDLSLDEAAERMRGPIGTKVMLKIQREATSPQELELELVRDRISLNPVFSALQPQENGLNIGYVRLSQFNANATEELMEAVTELETAGATAYILDLRNNPGGLLQAGIEIARLWLDQGTIVYTVNRYGIQDSFDANHRAITDAPLVVLVNRGTASASEILSGALQDNGRAKLVGEKTFGKGLIQSLFNLPDGSGLAVTVAKYETPAHHDINKQGIIPDVTVPTELMRFDQVATPADRQFQAAVDLLQNTVVLAGAA